MNGIILSLTAGVFLGLFQVFHGKAQSMPIRTATLILLIISAVLVNGALLAARGTAPYVALGASSALLFALAGAIHFSGGWLLMGLSQRRVGVGVTGLLVGATPVFTALIAWTALGETLDFKDIAGIALVVAGVGLASWK